jgi:hypothetical protein
MMRVSVPAVRKWRKGESITGENRRRLSILAAFVELLDDHFHIEDPATWMEMPLTDGTSITGVDVYAAGHHQHLLEYSGGHREPEHLLDDSIPEWRTSTSESEFEIFEGPDGQPAFSRREHPR